MPLLAEDLLGASPKKVYLYNQALRAPDGTFLAWLTVTCSERSLYYEYLAALNQEDRNAASLYASDGKLLTGSLPEQSAVSEQLGAKIRDHSGGQAHLTVQGQEYLAVWLQLPFSETIFCLLKSQNTLKQEMMQMQLFCILSALVILLLSSVFLYWISLRLAEPVEDLAETMEKAGRGNLAVRTPVRGDDEIAYLSQAFNAMLQRMNDLIEHLATEREQKKEAELKASVICWRISSSCCGPVPTGTVRSCHFQKKSRPCATTLPCRNSVCWMRLMWCLTCKKRLWTASCRA